MHSRTARCAGFALPFMLAATAASASACPQITMQDTMDVPQGAYPQVYELAEFETVADCTLTFSGNPRMAELNADINGNGPVGSVEERLPSEPLVVVPYNEIGTYGGTLNGISRASQSGTSGISSWRLSNLVRFDDDLETIVPHIARGWEWNEDQTELTMFLREGHKWSDGAPFTARDIAFWFADYKSNEALYPNFESIWSFGGEPMTVDVIDDTTVRFGFAVANPNFLTFIATSWRRPFLPAHFMEQFHIDHNEDADALAQDAGFDTWVDYFVFLACAADSLTCPSPLIRDEDAIAVPTLASFVKIVENGTERSYVANPYFFMVDTAGNQLPYIDRKQEDFIADREVVNLRVIDGGVDMKEQGLSLADFPLYAENTGEGGYELQMVPTGAAAHIVYTLNYGHQDEVLRDIVNDARFRRALSIALNRNEINELIYFGQGTATQWLPADHNSHPMVTDEDRFSNAEFDAQTANALLDEMGLTERDGDGTRLRPDGAPLVLRLDFAPQAGAAEVHELVRDYWAAIGVRLELQEVTTDVFRSLAAANDHDLTVWHGDGNELPGVVAGVGNTRMAPPFREGYVVEWRRWLDSDGAEGLEPSADAIRAFEVVRALQLTEPGSQDHAALVRELVDLHTDNVWLIGVVGDVPAPLIVSDAMGNVPDYHFLSFTYYRHYPYLPAQWFLRDDS